ncbi:hopanoid biosynthesis-associated RND transporter HpnN [Methylomonas lenta]|uniref:Hopanoid biosynthesis-associated RND transporter HpnN n=1 Tax=Methylomonas lenta TaxID=980561 RepID=A0A177NI35_9GAMM|nr:MMPL family transporter [Methylomonas lenta]OAI17776.1 hopanoid biosynthesis-associated RND transporter HpnN [Methylomonas lenta]
MAVVEPSIFNKIVNALFRLPLRFPWLILLVFILLGGVSLNYTIQHLGMNTNTSDLLSQDLPFLKIRAQLDKAFPQDSAAIIVVVESPTPEQTAMAANFVNQRILSEHKLFESSYIPVDNSFFRQQGFLYLSLDELDALSTKLIDAQPFIGYLSAHYHFAGLLDVIDLALEGHEQDLAMPLAPLLNAIDQSLLAVKAGQPHYLSWQTLLTDGSLGADQSRRLIISKPHLDFQQLMPAGLPMDYLRHLATEVAAEFPGVNLSFTGETALEHEEMETVSHGMLISGIASLLLVCSALWIGLRSFRLLLVTFIALVLGLILTAGFAAVAIGHLNLISIAFAVLYIGLGVDFATHLCLRYQECRQQGMDTEAAILNSMDTVGRSLFLCALTTAIGFFAFVPTDFKGVSELGVISGVGIFIGLLVSLSLLPALLKLLPIKPSVLKTGTRLPRWVYLFPFSHAKAIRISAVLIALLAGLTLTQLRFDSNPVDLRDPTTQSVIAFKKLLKTQADSPFATSALTDNLAHANELAVQFSKLPSVHQAITLSSLVAEQQDEKLDIIDNLNMIMPVQLNRFEDKPESSDVRAALIKLNMTLQAAIAKPQKNVATDVLQKFQLDVAEFIQYADSQPNPAEVYAQLEQSILKLLPHTMLMLRDGLTATAFDIDDIPADLRAQWVGQEGTYRVLVLPKQDLNNPENLKVFVNEVLATYPHVFGLPIGDVSSGQAVVKAFIEAFSGALLMIFLLLLILTRSLKTTLLVVTPLLLAALLTGACNVLLNNPFNFANIIVLPLLLGMGVDSAIHIVHRLQHLEGDQTELLQSSSARGVFYSALTTLCSFSSLAFNTHAGTASMGLLLAIGISLTIVCSLLVLPAMACKPVTK